jgi:hypothetical protein
MRRQFLRRAGFGDAGFDEIKGARDRELQKLLRSFFPNSSFTTIGCSPDLWEIEPENAGGYRGGDETVGATLVAVRSHVESASPSFCRSTSYSARNIFSRRR